MSKNPIDKLVHELAKLPSVGEKTALRLALHILRQPADYGQSLARALNETVAQVGFCRSCCNVAMTDFCGVCADPKRNEEQICVVEDVADLMSIEKTRAFSGRYHVLHGALSPIDGIGPESLRIRELLARLKTDGCAVREIILATNPDVNGDATALYLARLFKPFPEITITKLASGIPVGGHIEFIDSHTLSKALERRLAF